MTKYWFKPKRFGWGLYPVSWEGWVATLVLVGVLLLVGRVNGIFGGPVQPVNGFLFVAEVLVLSVLFVLAMHSKTDGKLKWNWG